MEHAGDLAVGKKMGVMQKRPTLPDFLISRNCLLELYISILHHFTKDTEYNTALVSFLTLLTVRTYGARKGYPGFTPKFSALMAISCLCITKYSVGQRTKTIKQKMQ